MTTSYTVFTEWMPVPKSQLYYQTLEHAWVEANESWIRSSACQRLTTILSSAAISKSASQVICFGLGGLELGECERRALDEATPGDRGLHSNNTAIRACMIQHAAALTMATVLGRRFRVDKKPLAILTQDPAYTANDKALLTNKGFQVIEGRGSLAFTHVDDNTLVFSCHPDVPVKQIVADIARPAAMVWNKPDAWEEDSSKWLVNVYEKSRHLVA